jgi:hypothetical protein
MVSNEVRLKLAQKRERRSLRQKREDASEPPTTDSPISGVSDRETRISRQSEYTRPSSFKRTHDNTATVPSSIQGTASSFTFDPSGLGQGIERKSDDAKYICEDPQTLQAFWLLLEISMQAKATGMGEEAAKRYGSAELEDTMLELQLTDSIGRTSDIQDTWVIHRELDNSVKIRLDHLDRFPRCTSLNQADGVFLRGIQNLMTALQEIGIPEVAGGTTWSFASGASWRMYRAMLSTVAKSCVLAADPTDLSFDLYLVRKRGCMLIRC